MYMVNPAGDGSLPVTFFLITYNQENYIRWAIEGAFNQTYSPLEIVISDDCSTDGTFRIIEEMCAAYNGPHKIVINRNRQNLGLIGHINSITALSSGELIIYAAGDDISLPARTTKLVERYLATGRRASLIHSSVCLIDNSGKMGERRVPPIVEGEMDLSDMAISGALIIGATSAFTRKIEKTFGLIRYDKCIEDLVMGFRSALTGGLEYLDEPLVLYRHEAGITAGGTISNQSFSQMLLRKIHSQEGYLAVLSQRVADLKRIENDALLPLVVARRKESLLRKTVWVGNYRFFRMFSYAARRGLLNVFFNALFKVTKWRLLFPFKKMMQLRYMLSQ